MFALTCPPVVVNKAAPFFGIGICGRADPGGSCDIAPAGVVEPVLIECILRLAEDDGFVLEVTSASKPRNVF